MFYYLGLFIYVFVCRSETGTFRLFKGTSNLFLDRNPTNKEALLFKSQFYFYFTVSRFECLLSLLSLMAIISGFGQMSLTALPT